MPFFDGEQALSFVLKDYPKIPFIMVTGELNQDQAIEFITRGATDYVLKNNLARLIPAIERALAETKMEAERDQAVEKLQHNEQYYRTLFEDGPLSKWVFDRDTFRILDVNVIASLNYGYSREEFLKMTMLDIWHEDETSRLRARVLLLDKHDKSPTRHRKKDGLVVHVVTNWSAIDHQGRPSSLSIITAITHLMTLTNP